MVAFTDSKPGMCYLAVILQRIMLWAETNVPPVVPGDSKEWLEKSIMRMFGV